MDFMRKGRGEWGGGEGVWDRTITWTGAILKYYVNRNPYFLSSVN